MVFLDYMLQYLIGETTHSAFCSRLALILISLFATNLPYCLQLETTFLVQPSCCWLTALILTNVPFALVGGQAVSTFEDEEGETRQVRLRLPKADASRITARLLAEQVIDDLTVEDPPVEDVIDQVFSQEHA